MRKIIFAVLLMSGCAPKWTVKKVINVHGDIKATQVFLCDPVGECYEVHKSVWVGE